MMKKTMTVLMLVLCTAFVSADVVFSYEANPDPTTVGWTEASSGTAATVTGGTETDGTKYWEINDGAVGRTAYKSDVLPTYATTRGSAIGWTYTLTMKAVGTVSPVVADIRLLDGWYVWNLCVTNTGVYTNTAGTTLIKAMDTTDAYHTYQIICDPADTNQVDFYVDGEKVLSGYTVAATYSGYNAIFGSSSTGGTGIARYNEVTFETGVNPIPEPGMMLLVGAGSVVALMKRRRK